MPSTYLNLCNMVLRRINEVEMTSAEFADVRGVQGGFADSYAFTLQCGPSC